MEQGSPSPVSVLSRFAGCCGSVIGALMIVGGSGGAAQAGFLDFLFQRPAPSFQRTAPGPLPAASFALPEINVTTRKPAAFKPVAVAPALTTAIDLQRTLDATRRLANVANQSGYEAAFMVDPTLMRGDVVVVKSGLHVFSGRQGDRHRAVEFDPLARSSKAQRKDLQAIQTTGHYDAINPKVRSAFVEVLTIHPARIVTDDTGSPRKQAFKVVRAPTFR